MATINKDLPVFPYVKEIAYGDKIDSVELNMMFESLEKSVLRALLRSKNVKGDVEYTSEGMVAAYTAMSKKIGQLDWDCDSSDFGTIYDSDRSVDVGIRYDTTNGYATLNEVNQYSLIPRGEKYNGRISPEVSILIDDVEQDPETNAYNAMDSDQKTFWFVNKTPNTAVKYQIVLPPALVKRFNYINVVPFPLYSSKITSITYGSDEIPVDKFMAGNKPLLNHDGGPVRLYLQPKEFDGVITIHAMTDDTGKFGFSELDIGFADYINQEAIGYIPYPKFKLGTAKTVTLEKVVIDYYFDNVDATNLLQSSQPPLAFKLIKGTEDNDGNITITQSWYIDITTAGTTGVITHSFNNEVVTFTETDNLYLQFTLNEQIMTTPVVRGTRIDYT